MGRTGKYDRGSNTCVSFIATVLLSFLVVVLTMAVVGLLSGADLLVDMFLNMIDVLPYGSVFAEFAFSLISQFMGTTVNSAIGILGTKPLSYLDALREFCKLCLSAGLFPAFNEVSLIATGVKDEKGLWNFLKSVVITMLSGYLAAFFAGLLLQLFFEQVSMIPAIAQGIISGGLSIAIIVCVFMIVKLLFFSGGSMLLFISYFISKYILVNLFKVMVIYLMIFITLAFVLVRDLGVFIASSGGLIAIMIMIIGLDMMIKSAFGFEN